MTNARQRTMNNKINNEQLVMSNAKRAGFLARRFLLFSLFISIFSFASCPAVVDNPNPLSLPEDCGSFTLDLGGNRAARTILPDSPTLDDFAVINLNFAPDTTVAGNKAVLLNADQTNYSNTNSSQTFILVEGTYNLTVRAYNDAGKAAGSLLAMGSINIEIVAGQHIAKTVKLNLLSSSTVDGNTVNGNFSWDITLDTSTVTVQTATMTIKDSGGNTQGAVVDLTGAAANSSRNLAPGIYTVVFKIEGKEGTDVLRFIEWNELMYVYGNLTGSFTKTFKDEDFHRTHWNITFNYDNGGPFEAPDTPDLGNATQSVLHGDFIDVEKVSRPGYRFDGWFTEPACTNEWVLETTPVHQDMALYAKWTANSAAITLEVEEIINGDEDFSALLPITIVRQAGHANEEYEIEITGAYDSILWEVDPVGVYTAPVTGTADTFTLSGTNNNYNTLGGHVLKLTVTVGGKEYKMNIPFIVEDPPTPFTIAGFEAQLAAVTGTTDTAPSTVTLSAATFTTDTSIPDGGFGWGDINAAVLAAGNYVVLDLSNITFEGNVIEGAFTPSGNSMSIIQSNSYIKGIILPDSIKTIGNYAFKGCSGLTGSLTIPAGVTSIGYNAFDGCSGLTGALIIPDRVRTIDYYAFNNCSNLTGVTIPSSVITIGSGNFNNCSNLTDITVDTTNIYYASEDGVLFNKAKTMLIQCPEGKTGTYTIPAGVTSIEANAFSGCSGLTGALTIPDSVTTIADYAFEGCSGLTGSLTIPAGVTTIGTSAFQGCSGLTGSPTIPAGVTTIGIFAFEGCSGFTGTLAIPSSVTSIKAGAFSGCSGFTGTLTIPSSVTSIEGSAFKDCSGFTGVTIPSSLTTIGFSVFRGCNGLTSVTIPSSVTSIGDNAFYGCSNLTSVTFDAAGITIGGFAFSSNLLTTVYESGGAGTYTRPDTSSDVWTKQ